jgi:hypothetical protein
MNDNCIRTLTLLSWVEQGQIEYRNDWPIFNSSTDSITLDRCHSCAYRLTAILKYLLGELLADPGWILCNYGTTGLQIEEAC